MTSSLVVYVVPKSGRQGLALDKAHRLKVYLKSVPENGAANRELIKFFAQLLHLTQSQITIVSGLTSRRKRLLIDADLTEHQIMQACGIEVQNALF
jgi:uncharacterized protein (TIGR00251 family)